jgi:hypothetical protein
MLYNVVLYSPKRNVLIHKLLTYRQIHFNIYVTNYLRGPFAKLVDSPHYSESELCGGAVTVSFSKYLP